MTKQELARKRNYFKFVLSGIAKPIDFKALSEYEQEEWSTILNIKDNLLKTFNNISKQQGLHVNEKCWCGKIAKYEPVNYPDYQVKKVCKNHINYDEI